MSPLAHTTTRRLAAVAAVALAGPALAGCGDDGDTTVQPEPAVEAEAPDAARDLLAVASSRPNLDRFTEALARSGLAETLDGEGPFTVFAPRDDAFADARDADVVGPVLTGDNPEALADLLAHHVVPRPVLAADLTDGQQLRTLAGGTLTVDIEGEEVRVGEGALPQATIVRADVPASNGLIQVVDAVIRPE